VQGHRTDAERGAVRPGSTRPSTGSSPEPAPYPSSARVSMSQLSHKALSRAVGPTIRPCTPPAWRPALFTAGIGIVLGFAAISTPGAAELHAQESSLQVQGRAVVEVAPDRGRIAFAVETEAETAREAGEANARVMDRVVAAVRGTQIEGIRVETSGYMLHPRYRYVGTDRRQEVAGYTARNTLQVIVDDVEAVGRLVDTALEAGANRVSQLVFEVRDPEPHRLEALRLAVEQARSEAEVMARALGMRLGEPSMVQGGAERPSPVMPYYPGLRMEMAMADQPETPVEAGMQSVSANVSITYRLHPDR
jgi:uncharacterized protein